MGVDYEAIEEKRKACKGLIFRGYSSMFPSRGGFEKREGFRLLRKKSCPGCAYCGFYLDTLDEMISGNLIVYNEIENDKLYGVRTCNERTDWETGICDDYDFEFYKIDEKEMK